MCQVIPIGLGPVDGGPPNPAVYSTACSCSELYSAHASTLTSTFQDRVGPVTETLTTFTDSSYQPPENCCIKCWIGARDVQIIYWPVETDAAKPSNATDAGWNVTSAISQSSNITPAPTPYSLVQDGFTYISPSVYVAYRDVQAAAVCPSFGNTYPRGKAYNTTIAYAPDQLSTSVCTTNSAGLIEPAAFGQFAVINYTEYQYSTSAWSQCAKEIEAGSGGSRSIDGPFFSIPGDLKLIDPSWHTCSAVFNGVYDPPRVLSKAPDVVTGGSGPSPASPTAAPAHAPESAMVPPTPAPNPAPHDPPTNNSPPNNPPLNDPPAKDPSAANPQNSPAANSPDQISPSNGPSNSPPVNKHPVNNPSAGDPPSDQSPAHQPPKKQAPAGQPPAGSASTIVVVPQPAANPPPTPSPSPIIMHSPAPPTPITANGFTISRAPIGSGVGVGPGTRAGGNAGGNTGDNTGDNYGNNAAGGVGGARGDGGVVIAGVTYSSGASTKLPGPNGGTPLSVGSDHIFFGSSTFALPPAASPSPVLIAGNSISIANNGGLIIGSSTIAAGAPASIAYDHVISVGESSAVIDGTTFALTPLPTAAAAPASVITLSNGAVVTAGAAPAIVSGTTVALASNGASLVVNGKSFSIRPASLEANAAASPVLTVGEQVFTAASTGFAIGDQTVKPGAAAITVSGTAVSLGPNGQLKVGASTVTLPSHSGSHTTVGGVVIDPPTPMGTAGAPGGTVEAFTGKAERFRVASRHLAISAAFSVFGGTLLMM